MFVATETYLRLEQLVFFGIYFSRISLLFKGQLISKANGQAKDSSKKRTNEFVFTSMRRVFVCFLEESSARKKRFGQYFE